LWIAAAVTGRRRAVRHRARPGRPTCW